MDARLGGYGGEAAMMADAAGDGLPPAVADPPRPSRDGTRLSLVRRVPPVIRGPLALRRGRLGRPAADAYAEVRSGVLLVYGSRREAAAGTAPPALLLPLDGEAVIRRVGGGGGGGRAAAAAPSAAADPSVGRSLRVFHPEAGTATLTFPRVEDARHWQVVLSAAAGSRALSPADFPIVAPVGRGGSGSVFAAVDAATGEAVALKVVQKYDAYASDGSLRHAVDERLVLELAAGGSPYVLQLRHAFQTAGGLYLVSEWCGGGDLRSALRRRPGGTLTRAEGVRLLSQLVVAIGYLHRLGVVHRDIKAENVLLASAPPAGADGGPDLSAAVLRLGDMGLAKKLPAGRHGRTRSFCGTDEYMAPEVVLGTPYGAAVDWWSFGVLAARLLTGRSPYSGPPGGRSPQNHRLFEAIVTEEPALPDGLDADVEELLRGLLTRDEGARWGEARIRRSAFFATVDWGALETGADAGAAAPPPSSTAASSTTARTAGSGPSSRGFGGAASLADDLSGLDVSRYADLTLGSDAPGAGGGGAAPAASDASPSASATAAAAAAAARRGGMRRRVKGLLGGALGVGSGMTRRPSATSIVGYSFTSDGRGGAGGGGGGSSSGTDGSGEEV